MSSRFQRCSACGEERQVAFEGYSQCFSLACGLRRPTGALKGIGRILQFLYEQAHSCLLSGPASEVYRELVEQRGLLPSVVAHTMVGLIGDDVDVSGQFHTAIEEADAAVEATRPKGSGRPKKEEAAAHAMAIWNAARLREQERELTEGLDGHRSCLAFFHTNLAHQPVRVVFHRGDLGQTTFGDGGLFEHGLTGAFDPPEGLLHRRQRYVLEQELELLQLQSLSAAVAVERGHQPEGGYMRACATGAACDAEEVRGLGRTPVAICGDSGLLFVEQLRQEVNLTACFAGKAVDDFIRELGNGETAHEALKAFIDQRQLFTRPFERVRDEIDMVRASDLPPFQRLRWAGERLVQDLRERGHLYCDERVAYIYLHDTKDVVAADTDSENFQLLMRKYGVAATDRDMFLHILQSLWMTALEKGTRAKVSSMVRYVRRTHRLYVFDHGTTVFRIGSDGVDAVENGTDGVLFVRNRKWQPFKVNLATRPDFHRLPELLLGAVRLKDVGLSRQDIQILLQLWVFVMLFPELFPTKVILALIGVAGSGKTSILKLVGRLLFGEGFAVSDITDDMRDLDAAITSEPFVAIDNADRKIKGLDDKLAVAATGGTLKRRLYYTTNRLVEFPITATIGITSRTPHFRREDISDRLLPIMLDRFEKFGAFSRIQDEMLEQRDELMSVLIANLRVIVADLERQKDWHPRTTFRMADFAEFALKVAPSMGCQDPEAVLGRLSALQERFTIEDEPLFDYLDAWLTTAGNIGRFVTTRQFFEELRIQEGDNLRSFDIDGVMRLGHKLSDLLATLQRSYGMEERTGRSRSREIRFRHERMVKGAAA